MHSSLQKFIEDHIEWIDENNWEDFWNEAVRRYLNNNTVKELADILESAGIETKSIRLKLLDHWVSSSIAALAKLPLTYKYTIYQFVDSIRLDRRFGFNLRQIESYILINKYKWDCEIWRENNDWYIRRNK